MNWILISVLLYLLLQFAIGIYVSRKIKTQSDFFLADRNLGLGIVSMSLFATWFGAETCIGASAAIFASGLSGSRADPFGYFLCLLIFGLMLAGPLRKLGLTTLGDFYKQRFSGNVEKIAVLIIIPTSLFWAAAQVRAFGEILSSVSGFDVNFGISLAAIFVVGYTFLGGLLGDAITDVLQGTVLIMGLAVLLFFSVDALGGPAKALSLISPEQWSIVDPKESFLHRMERWAIPIVGSLVAQEMISRTLAAKNEKIAVRGSVIASFLYLFVGLMPVMMGLLGPHLFHDLPRNDQFLASAAQRMLSPALFVLFIGALISAILSTVDSTILAISAFLTQNIFNQQLGNLKSGQKLFCSRLIVMVSGAVAYLLAVSSESIYSLVEESSYFGTTGVVTITLMGLWFKNFGNAMTAMAVLVCGVATTIYFKSADLFMQAPFLYSLGVCIILYFFLSFLVKKKKISSSFE